MTRQRIKSAFREWEMIIRDYRWRLMRADRLVVRLIIVIDGTRQHGGFVDRLKGIISFYALSKKFGWEFNLIYTSPFFLSDYLLSRQSNLFCNSIEKHFPRTRPLWAYDDPRIDLERIISRLTRGGIHHIYSNIDFIPQLYPESTDHGKKWGELFRELFFASPKLVQVLEKALPDATNIGFHLRFTNLLGDFTDVGAVNLSARKQQELLDLCLDALGNEIARRPETTPFLFTDSVRFLNAAQNRFPTLRTIPGLPVHTDLVKVPTTGQSHSKTLLDFMALTRMKEVCFIKSDMMYNSKFSQYASFAGNVPFTVVQI